jgi:hypothetical protein
MTPQQKAIRLSWAILALILTGADQRSPALGPSLQVRVDRGHPWRPPFGLDRIGRPLTVVVEADQRPLPDQACFLSVIREGKTIATAAVNFPDTAPSAARLEVKDHADEVHLWWVRAADGERVPVLRQKVDIPEFEADAIARPDRVVNPVDLGTILVPSDWLLLGPEQAATLDVAAMSRLRDLPNARLTAQYGSAPGRAATASLSLRAGATARLQLKLPDPPPDRQHETLAVAIDDGHGKSLWHKSIPVMLVAHPPQRPRFGATSERLRYDAPISVRDPKSGSFSAMPYEGAWAPILKDVVVWLPNGARFVFWRGSSYIPFWAGQHNTGACYEWAEMISQPGGAVDCVEPLMDKELRYGRVEIVESTAARVHVRWSYQSTDFHYQVWGDAAVEDYYFYPDGFGTRVVNLEADPKNDYELSEFIILTPQGAYPFAVLPDDPVDALFLDGRTRTFRFPNPAGNPARKPEPADVPAIYRLRLHQQEGLAAVSFNPNLTTMPPVVFAPFFDRGEMVTPCYWGSHWPLARGNSTGRTIDDRLALTPCHNSVMSWAGSRPVPLRSANLVTLDALGRSRPMTARQWAWLIGMTDATDGRLLAWARSFATPPSLDLRGARLGFDGYVPERRAIRLTAEGREVAITIKPGPPCVNPVFEFEGVPKGELQVSLGGRPVDAGRYAWDGRTLWLDATIPMPTELRLTFTAVFVGSADAPY